MTTAGPSPTATPITTAVPLLRRPDDRVLRGVCAAFGRSTGTDPVLWRVVIGVLTLFGGTGLVLYGAGWLLIPEAGSDGSIADRLLRGKLSRGSLVVLAVGAAVLLLVALDDRSGVVPLLAAGLLVYVVLRGDQRALRLATPEEARAGRVDPDPTTTTDTATDASGGTGWSAGPYPRPPRRRRSPLGLLTLSSALVVTGVLLALHATGADGITAGRVLAADLLVVGIGLLVGARWGRARWLVLPAAALALALGVTASARVPVELSAGERTWTTAGDHRLGIGEATLDLRGTADLADTRVEMGAGELHLLIPAGRHVEVTAVVAAGQVDLPDEAEPVSGSRLRVVRTYGPADAPLVHVHASIGAGEIEVIPSA